jgi:hypothetical protein
MSLGSVSICIWAPFSNSVCLLIHVLSDAWFQSSAASCMRSSGVPGGEVLNTPPPPPGIPKFWQSWAKFPVPWKIHPQQPNKNMGFTHLQIERNPWLGATASRPRFPCPLSSTKFVEPPTYKKILGMPRMRSVLFGIIRSVGVSVRDCQTALLKTPQEHKYFIKCNLIWFYSKTVFLAVYFFCK